MQVDKNKDISVTGIDVLDVLSREMAQASPGN
jgi:hypothetical protein